MSYIDDRHNIELCPNRGLSIITCGWQQCLSGHTCSRRIYTNHSLTFVLKGKGRYTVGDSVFEISAGECFAIFPDISITYTADEEDPWEYIFAIVTGEDVLPLLRCLGITKEHPFVPFRITLSIIGNLNAMWKASASGRRLGYDVIGYFFLCTSEIAEQQNALMTKQNPKDLYVDQSIAYMKTNYPYDLSISGVAAYVGIEQSYLYRIFRERTGVSPREWLVNWRLTQALEVMQDPTLSTTEIAHSVGFYDLPHFTKAFRARYGKSPREFRKENGQQRSPKEYKK